MKRERFLSILACLGLLAGCGGTSPYVPPSGASGGTRTFTVTEPSTTLARDGQTVDSLEMEGFDRNGNVIYPPTVEPFGATVVFPNFPPGVARIQLDYLADQGHILHRAEHDISPGQTLLADPDQFETSDHQSHFTIAPKADGFELVRTVTGPSIPSAETQAGQILAQQSGDATYSSPLKLKGVCYSPAPINFSNKDGPAVGDLFWDTFQSGGQSIYNWYGLWGFGALGDTGYSARDDLKQIRALGANSIRVYSMTSRQLESKDSIPAPGTGHHFTHELFLGRCWNNGNQPLHVLVGIPLPDVCFRADITPREGEIAFWEHVLAETVEDTKNFPAVIGYVIMNEHDAQPTSFPRDPNSPSGPYVPGEPSRLTDYFYSQTARYADQVKAAAPNKLVGWALHDVPEFVQFASVRPATGQTYMQQLHSFDFWGVNTYHNDSLDAIFSTNAPGNYTTLPPGMKKPVLFTEFGWPATTHRDGKLYEDATTQENVARTVTARFTEALDNPLLLGTYYFEFQDEWWKQGGGQNFTWDPTTAGPNTFPNGYWDEEGFGLFSTSVTSPRQPTDSPFPADGSGPALPLDTLTPRIPIIEALKAVYTNPKYK